MRAKNPIRKDSLMAVALVVMGLLVGGAAGYVWGASNHHEESVTIDRSMTPDSDGVTVGGTKMVQQKDIIQNAIDANNIRTLVSFVQLAGLVETLKGVGPFTLFAPTDAAFAKLDAATIATLRQPEHIATLKKTLTYHIVPGAYTSAALKAIAAKNQKLKTLQGEELGLSISNSSLLVEDAKGGRALVETADAVSNNGVTHIITDVLMPR